MPKKKSYMNSENILTEGFFNVIKNILAIAGAKYAWDSVKKKKAEKAMKSSGPLRKSILKLNKDIDWIEDYIKKEWEIDVNLDKYNIKDFK